MPTRTIPRSEWNEFLAAFSRRHRAWLASVEGDGAGSRAGTAPDRPLKGVAADEEGDRVAAIRIEFEPGSVRIENPREVRLRQRADGAERALEIQDERGGCTRLTFRATVLPDQLDGLAPGEE